MDEDTAARLLASAQRNIDAVLDAISHGELDDMLARAGGVRSTALDEGARADQAIHVFAQQLDIDLEAMT